LMTLNIENENDQRGAKWIVIRGQSRGHSKPPPHLFVGKKRKDDCVILALIFVQILLFMINGSL
jgi:hypothetical protein